MPDVINLNEYRRSKKRKVIINCALCAFRGIYDKPKDEIEFIEQRCINCNSMLHPHESSWAAWDGWDTSMTDEEVEKAIELLIDPRGLFDD